MHANTPEQVVSMDRYRPLEGEADDNLADDIEGECPRDANR